MTCNASVENDCEQSHIQPNVQVYLTRVHTSCVLHCLLIPLQDCPTPTAQWVEGATLTEDQPVLTGAVAGSTCVDVSAMGAKPRFERAQQLHQNLNMSFFWLTSKLDYAQCTNDVKGSGAGLLGDSVIPLSIWMSERLVICEDTGTLTDVHWIIPMSVALYTLCYIV